MTILIDYINHNKDRDPGYWYLWALDFKNTYIFLFTYQERFLKRKKINIDKLPPQPGYASMWIIFFSAIELYLKTFLIKEGGYKVKKFLSSEYRHHLKRLLDDCKKVANEKGYSFNNADLNWIISVLEKQTGTDDWTVVRYPGKTFGMFGRKSMIPPLIFLEDTIKPLVWIKD